ncbi:Papilin-like 4 [Homarus americanus]|uniref:Papilin-like 4 n=1 Tax=Homarus americanus TaxID=6706 RepID=A0A8J5JW48_HOMAM|nr:Papilin-like 4 [Homarus americanus]
MEFLILLVSVMSVASALRGNSILEDAITEGVDCNAPQDVGTCSGQEEAWYYNSAEGSCIFFVYSGCGGSGNRFVNRMACEQACEKFKCPDLDCPDSCTRTLGSDGCKICACTKAWLTVTREPEILTLLHYDASKGQFPDTNTVVVVKVSGPRKNALLNYSAARDLYEEKSDCLLVLNVSVISKTEASVVCGEPLKRGYCRALHHKWAWVSENRRCEQFVYGGCGGNENSFETEEMCREVCSGV